MIVALSLGLSITVLVQDSYSTPQTTVFSVPDSATSFRFDVARNTLVSPLIWPNPGDQVEWAVGQSNDGGATWSLLGSSLATGGQVIDSDTGSVVATSWDNHALRGGVGRLVRVVFTPRAIIVTSCTASVS